MDSQYIRAANRKPIPKKNPYATHPTASATDRATNAHRPARPGTPHMLTFTHHGYAPRGTRSDIPPPSLVEPLRSLTGPSSPNVVVGAIDHGPSFLAEHQVHDPAPADVRSRAAAVVQDVFAVTARVLERVGQDRHRGEVSRLIHQVRQRDRRDRPPRGGEGDGAERVAEDAPDGFGHVANLGRLYPRDHRGLR